MQVMETRSVVIEAVNGRPAEFSPGYVVYAVKLDAAGDVVMGQQVGGSGLRIGAAYALAHDWSLRPESLGFDANHVIVNDGTGKTFETFEVRLTEPLPAAAPSS